MLKILLAAATLSIAASPAMAAPCKDARGKFIKCPPPRAMPAPRCRKDGRFVKCGTPGARRF